MTKFNQYMKEGTDLKAEEEILNFFADNPSPPDSKVHNLADKLGIDTHEFEGMIYKVLGSILGSGRAKEKGFTEKDADKKELDMGIKVEMEHTNNKVLAKRIAMDHLAEFGDYYSKLVKWEKQQMKGKE